MTEEERAWVLEGLGDINGRVADLTNWWHARRVPKQAQAASAGV